MVLCNLMRHDNENLLPHSGFLIAHYFKEIVGKVIATREPVKQELKELGFSFPDSMSNFIFATHERIPAADIFEACKKENIFVRYFKKPRIDNYLRISIGTDDEMDELLTFLKEYIAQRQ